MRRDGCDALQQLLDSTDPRFAKLKAQFVAHLAADVDAAEERLAKIIDAHAQRSRKAFRVVRGDKDGA